MTHTLLEITDLSMQAGDSPILHNISMTIHPGELHVLMGPNGAGKSTLGNAIMGHPAYTRSSGRIMFNGADITEMNPDKRARLGIFLSFQNPEEVPGITVENFLRTACSTQSEQNKKDERKTAPGVYAFRKDLYRVMDDLSMDHEAASRYLNVGFSGGEKKKSEILQMLMLKPKLAILDETDSGLDVDAVKTVSQGIDQFRSSENALLVITHNAAILKQLKPDYVHVLIQGRLVTTGDASLVTRIGKEGFTGFIPNNVETQQEVATKGVAAQ